MLGLGTSMIQQVDNAGCLHCDRQHISNGRGASIEASFLSSPFSTISTSQGLQYEGMQGKRRL
eukprot:scaffold1148_cov335-Pavlova_lutheri.AAC.5